MDKYLQKSGDHLHCLDGQRGLAAILVVVWHISGNLQTSLSPAYAYLAVDFFFMLSGFVISHAYDLRLLKGFSVRDFMVARIIRLYPLILVGAGMGTLLWFARIRIAGDVNANSVVVAAISNTLLLPTAALTHLRPFSYPINGPLWSLASEMIINLIYAIFIFALNVKFLFSLAVASLFALIILVYAHGTLDVGFFWSDFELSYVRVLYPFLMGVLLRRLNSCFFRQLRFAHSSTLLLIFIFINPFGGGPFFEILAVAFLFPTVILFGASARPNRAFDGMWSRLGFISYPLYVTHYPIVVSFGNAARSLGLLERFPGLVAFCCFISALSFAVLIGLLDDIVRHKLRQLVR